MCGIAGILQYNRTSTVNEQKLTVCRDALLHRGPDFGANYIDQNLGLAHRRLSIIDLSNNANQPMVDDSNNYVIVYNGEIYNFQELKTLLQQKGFTFKTSSDTEVLLQMYICYGKAMLERLNGMFAFAIWDKQKRELFIARDRIGIKPLYFSVIDNSFVFASEAKALLKAYVNFEIDESHLNELIIYRYVSGNNTLFENISKLLPGHYLVVSEDGIKENYRWWNSKTAIQNHPTIQNPQEWFFNTFNNAVSSHMISDVPVGVLLSGGLDSSSICASLHYQKYENIKTFNVGFADFVDDETAIARKVADEYKFPFYNIQVEDDSLTENTLLAAGMLGDTLIHQNEPQLIAISKFANQHVKVLLSGEGADELMGGYVRYKALNFFAQRQVIKKALNFLPNFLKSARTNKLERYLSLKDINEAILFNSVNSFPADFAKLGIKTIEINNDYRSAILKEAAELYPNNSIRQAMYLDQHTYLCTLNDRNDKTTMLASIECRVPFLDHRLIEGLGTLKDEYLLKGKRGKYLLKEAYSFTLPKQVLEHRKIGFSVPWIKMIQKNEILMNHWNSMDTSEILNTGMFKLIDVKSLKHKFATGDTSNESLMRQLFFISLWYKFFKKNVTSNK